MTGVDDRLQDLEARVAALEARLTASAGATQAADDDTGLLTYGGRARFGGYQWEWEMSRFPGWLLRRPAAPLAAILAAAGHPARFEILQMLVTGPQPIAELQAALGLASPGQLYHHLKTLASAGLVEQPERGVYRVPAHAIFPVLALAAAATDVAERSGTETG
ncbi:winged helix-turn-helix transcriptional regulator [Planomonospora sp. ID67723]|nr:winged helix-turn-helix transcriptional regulator [Planomonospora sp. ID67723]